MAPQDGSAGVSFGQQGLAGAGYGTEPKRMRLSGAGDDAAESGSSTTRARPLTNKGSHYKAQRGRGETEASEMEAMRENGEQDRTHPPFCLSVRPPASGSYADGVASQ